MKKKTPFTDNMLEPPGKFQRLEQLRRVGPYVSQSALASIIADIKQNGIPEDASRAQFTKATKAALAGEYVYGPLNTKLSLLKLDGSKITVPALNWKSYIAALFEQSDTYNTLLTRTAARCPPSYSKPWGLIMYMDEVTPGNVLSARTTRKSWCVYASLLDFTLEELSQELAWSPLLHIRSKVVEDLQGGISQVFAALLKTIFLDGQCDPRLGLLLPKEGSSALKLFVTFKVVLQDGGSHKFCWSYKGDAGLKPCLLCNVQCDKEALDEDDMETSSFAQFLKYDELRIFTSPEILASYDRLKAKKEELSKAQFLQWQKAVGKTYHDMILPLDKELRDANLLAPAEQFAHDWMHCLCSNGTFSIAAFELINAFDSWEDLGPYLAKWVLPAHCKMNHLPDLFESKKLKKYKQRKRFQCEASDALSILPIFVFWTQKVLLPSNLATATCNAFLAVVETIFLLSEGQQWGLVTRPLLLHAVEHCLELVHQCSWHAIPKFHWPLHMGDQLSRWGKLPSCWTPERKNKILKKYAMPLKNTSNFEESIFQEIVAEEMAKLIGNDVFALPPYLVNPHVASKKKANALASSLGCNIEDVLTSREAKLLNGRCTSGDLALLDSSKDAPQIVEVWCFAQAKSQTNIFVLAQLLDLKDCSLPTRSGTWKMTANTALLPIESLLGPVTFCKLEDSTIRCLLPWHFCH